MVQTVISDDIHPKHIYGFYFKERGIPLESVAEAFEYLRLRNLIIPSINQPYSFYVSRRVCALKFKKISTVINYSNTNHTDIVN